MMVAKIDNRTTVEDFRNDCWPAMFEEASDEDIRWLRNVADLLERRARERGDTPEPDEHTRRN